MAHISKSVYLIMLKIQLLRKHKEIGLLDHKDDGSTTLKNLGNYVPIEPA